MCTESDDVHGLHGEEKEEEKDKRAGAGTREGGDDKRPCRTSFDQGSDYRTRIVLDLVNLWLEQGEMVELAKELNKTQSKEYQEKVDAFRFAREQMKQKNQKCQNILEQLANGEKVDDFAACEVMEVTQCVLEIMDDHRLESVSMHEDASLRIALQTPPSAERAALIKQVREQLLDKLAFARANSCVCKCQHHKGEHMFGCHPDPNPEGPEPELGVVAGSVDWKSCPGVSLTWCQTLSKGRNRGYVGNERPAVSRFGVLADLPTEEEYNAARNTIHAIVLAHVWISRLLHGCLVTEVDYESMYFNEETDWDEENDEPNEISAAVLRQRCAERYPEGYS